MELDFSRCRLKPFKHQAEDVAAMIAHPWFFITSEMRTGKTKIVIDAAQFMYEMGLIDRVIVVAPAPVRDVWADKRLGELAKHLWLDLHATVTEYHSSIRTWIHGPSTEKVLDFYVTNYEFLTSEKRLAALLTVCGPKTLLVLDESSYVKNWAAQRTKACQQLRLKCGRVVLLNGTPIFHTPLDLFSQGNLLHPSILQCKYITHYKARYAIEEPVLSHGGKVLTDPRGNAIKQISGWTKEGLLDLQRRFAPCTVRRLQKDCLDLPPKLDPVTLSFELDASTWRMYRDMRDELVVWLQSGDVAVASTAAIKVLRLSQITSGFLGGIEEANIDEPEEGLLDSLQFAPSVYEAASKGFPDDIPRTPLRASDGPLESTVPISSEKVDGLLWFLGQQLEYDPVFHVVVWCRWRAELSRALARVKERYPQFLFGELHGDQKPRERMEAMRLLHPETSPKDRPVFVIGIERTGSFGLNFTAAHTSIDLSAGYSPGLQSQKNDRVYGPGQTEPVAFYEIVATGPKGQKTIDHQIIAARRNGQNIASWTADAWIKALIEE